MNRGFARSSGAIGREGEAEMLAATGGANAHRGAIWTLGLLVAGAVLSWARVKATASRLPPPGLPDSPTITGFRGEPTGEGAESTRGKAGEGEARAGFPHVVGNRTPGPRREGRPGRDEKPRPGSTPFSGSWRSSTTRACCTAGGLRGLRLAQRGFRAVLGRGWFPCPRAGARWRPSKRDAREWLSSPGGAADLLSCACSSTSLEQRERDEDYGRRRRWVSVESLSFSFEESCQPNAGSTSGSWVRETWRYCWSRGRRAARR